MWENCHDYDAELEQYGSMNAMREASQRPFTVGSVVNLPCEPSAIDADYLVKRYLASQVENEALRMCIERLEAELKIARETATRCQEQSTKDLLAKRDADERYNALRKTIDGLLR